MKKLFSTLTLCFLFGIALLIGTQYERGYSSDNIYEQLNKFKDVLSMTEKVYVDTVNTENLVAAAISGMLSSLDPHSVYISAEQMKKVDEEFRGNFEGIGVEFDVLLDTIVVISPVPGGPSEALGIRAGDRIVKINDSTSIGIKRDDVPKKLRGPKGTHVKVSVARAGEKNLLDFDIVRDKIPLYSVDAAFMVNDEVGYISINRFSATTHQEFLDALVKLRPQGLKRLIVDLRGNPGGYLDQAYKMADELLTKGKKVVYTKGRRPEFDEEYVSDGSGRAIDLPLIVMIDHGSASASEIVSGAVQDWDRGLIVGETSFGKGLVQRQFDLTDKSAFRLTIARYYTPSGRSIQRPYGKDIAAYEREAFDRDETEGENVEHSNEQDSTRPLYKTAAGRKVYGGGGITPDYIVKPAKMTDYTSNLLRKNLFLNTSAEYMETHASDIKSKYGADLGKFVNDYTVDGALVQALVDAGKKNGVDLNTEQYAKDLPILKNYLKCYIARTIWASEGWRRAFLSMDTPFQKALSLFPEAEKIARLH